jgi:hypothetical protein
LRCRAACVGRAARRTRYRDRRLETIYECKLAALDALKQSLLHHAFTGQLTARALTAHAAE